MSKDNTCVDGMFHVVLRLKGDQARVTLFHEILRRSDHSWPWKVPPFARVQQCDQCDGLMYASPRLNPYDVKAAARQAGVKVFIDQFAPSTKCHGDIERYQHTRWISLADSHRLYRSQQWLEQNAPPRVIELPAAAATVPVIPTMERPVRIIYPDGTCNCECHEELYNKRFHHGSIGCCTHMFRPRSRPVRPTIIDAAVVTPNGEIIVDTATRVVRGGDRALMDHVMEAEQTAAAGDLDTEPWGGMVN